MKQECRRRVFENTVLRRIFGPKRGVETGGRGPRKPHERNEIYQIFASRRMWWAGHAVMGEMYTGFSWVNHLRNSPEDRSSRGNESTSSLKCWELLDFCILVSDKGVEIYVVFALLWTHNCWLCCGYHKQYQTPFMKLSCNSGHCSLLWHEVKCVGNNVAKHGQIFNVFYTACILMLHHALYQYMLSHQMMVLICVLHCVLVKCSKGYECQRI